MKYFKIFNTEQNYESYIDSSLSNLPNLSYCEDSKKLYYNPLFKEFTLSEYFQFLYNIASKLNHDDLIELFNYNYYNDRDSLIILRNLYENMRILDIYLVSKLKNDNALIKDDENHFIKNLNTEEYDPLNRYDSRKTIQVNFNLGFWYGVEIINNNETWSADICGFKDIYNYNDKFICPITLVEITSGPSSATPEQIQNLEETLKNLLVYIIDEETRTLTIGFNNGDGTYSETNSDYIINIISNTSLDMLIDAECISSTLLNSEYGLFNDIMDLYIILLRLTYFKWIFYNDFSILDYDFNNFDGTSWQETFDIPESIVESKTEIMSELNSVWEQINARMANMYGSNWKETQQLPKLNQYKILIPIEFYKKINSKLS